ncbi:hypothetical protein Gasu2_64470 [Galdieria sulphuraria]|nr:hypothetical protein Gasu2_64470 [Galdieria sulphuraria]
MFRRRLFIGFVAILLLFIVSLSLYLLEHSTLSKRRQVTAYDQERYHNDIYEELETLTKSQIWPWKHAKLNKSRDSKVEQTILEEDNDIQDTILFLNLLDEPRLPDSDHCSSSGVFKEIESFHGFSLSNLHSLQEALVFPILSTAKIRIC